MYKHLLRLVNTIKEESTRFQSIVLAVSSVMLFLNRPVGELLIASYKGISPLWGIFPIAGLIIFSYSKKISVLEERLQPRLEILFDENDAMFQQAEYLNEQGKGIRSYRVGIKNIGSSFMNNCSIRLDKLEDGTGWVHPKVPNGLQRKDGKGSFPLRPGEFKLADVVYLDERRNDQIQLYFWDGQEPLIRKEYKLTIGAYPEEGAGCVQKFKLFLDHTGKLIFKLDGIN